MGGGEFDQLNPRWASRRGYCRPTASPLRAAQNPIQGRGGVGLGWARPGWSGFGHAWARFDQIWSGREHIHIGFHKAPHRDHTRLGSAKLSSARPK